MKKQIPKFSSVEEEALFWENHTILDYVDDDEFKVVDPRKKNRFAFRNPEKKPEKQLISLRIDSHLLEKAKKMGKKNQAGYQSILRKWLEKGSLRYVS